MAISGGDGSIILTTKVDQSGLNKGMTSMQNCVKSLSSSFKALGSTMAAVFSITAIVNFSKQAGELATQTEASIQRLIDIYGESAQSVGDFIDANARAIGMSKASAASFASVYGNLFSVWADQTTNAELTNRYLNMTAVVASKTGRTVEDVQERIRSGLLGNTEAIEDLGVFVNVKTIEMTDAFQRMASGKSWEQLDAYTQQQIRSMAILEQATEKYGNTVADTTATTRSQYQAAYEDFKNTWGQVVNTVLIPVLNILTQVFAIATKGLQVMASLSGKTVENSGKTSNNIKQQTKEQEKLNKAVKKGLSSLDEINTLTEQSAENSADVGSGTQISGIGGVGANYDNSFVEQINTDLATIMGYVGFALAAIGIILICFGNIGWGIGFLIAGASIFSVSQAALSEGAEAEKVKNTMNGIIAGISLLALVLGIILVVTGGSLPLGIGLIIVGAAGLAAEVALNWDAIKTAISDFFTNNAGLIVGISLSLLVLGIILLITGVGIPLGIGLVVAGAAGLAATVALNWNAIKEKIVKVFNSVIDWIKTYGLLVLGILLCLTGAGIPLGIALIIKWAKDGAEKGVPLAAAIVDKVKEVWEKVKEFWKEHIAPVFTAEWWKNLGKKVMNGLIAGFEAGINGIIGMFEKMINWIVGGLNKISFNVPNWIPGIGGKKFGFNIPEVNFGRVSIPRLAQGAVIPPNREFLAVLGDQRSGNNIEAPESLIRKIVREEVGNNGFSGTMTIPIYIGGKKVYELVINEAKLKQMQTGKNPFALA